MEDWREGVMDEWREGGRNGGREGGMEGGRDDISTLKYSGFLVHIIYISLIWTVCHTVLTLGVSNNFSSTHVCIHTGGLARQVRVGRLYK